MNLSMEQSLVNNERRGILWISIFDVNSMVYKLDELV